MLGQSNHKPLESIFRKSQLKAHKRLQRMILQLHNFNIIVTYKTGSELVIADTLNRDYCNNDTEK